MTEEQRKELAEVLDEYYRDDICTDEAIDRIAEILELGDDE